MHKFLPLLACAGLILLASCNRGKDEEETPQPTNNVTVVPEEDVVPEAANETNAANVAETPPPPPEVSADQQTLDDADATGLTTRLPEEDQMASPSEPANSAHGH